MPIQFGNKIGDIPFSPQVTEGENILLAAKIWKIKFIDFDSKKIEVIAAKDGKKPVFFGGGVTLHPKIREKMLAILFDKHSYDVLNESCAQEIKTLRQEFAAFDIYDLSTSRPVLLSEKELQLFTFTGTRINRSLAFLLELGGIKNQLDEKDCRCVLEVETDPQDFFAMWETIAGPLTEIDSHIVKLVEMNPAILDFSKWGAYLPVQYQVILLKQRYFDFDGAMAFIAYVRFIPNKEQ